MPPKRKPTTNLEKDDDPKKKALSSSYDTIGSVIIDKSNCTTDSTTNSSLIISSDDEEMSEDEVDKSTPWCNYGANCYRKNLEHLKAFRHPTNTNEHKANHKSKKNIDTKDNNKSKSQSKSKSHSKNYDSDEEVDTTKFKSTSNHKDKEKGKLKDDDDTGEIPNSDLPSTNPKDKMLGIKKNSSSGDPEVETYKNVLKCALAKNKVSVDEKRMLRTYRRNNNIADQDHFRLLMQFGWSADEYEDGMKKDDDCDLDEERNVLEKNGFTIINIKKGKNMTKEQDNVFSRVCAKFFQTMSKAQANYNIVEVGVIVNADLRKKYSTKLAEFSQVGFNDVEWAFHGSTRESLKIISESGFLHPDNLNKAKGKVQAKKGGKKMAKPKITVLDDGFFGKGIYFSFFSDYAMFYSEERSSDQVLLSQVATGKTFKCSGRMDGVDCQKGYNSHYSPKGNEIVVFEPDQILPRYIITFATQDAEEREQEG